MGDDIGAICVSRPTNPTGNVLTDEEMGHLGSDRPRDKGIPVASDKRLCMLLPGIIFQRAKPFLERHVPSSV